MLSLPEPVLSEVTEGKKESVFFFGRKYFLLLSKSSETTHLGSFWKESIFPIFALPSSKFLSLELELGIF